MGVFGRRIIQRRPRLVGRPPNDWALEVQEALDDIILSHDNGLPAGAGTDAPQTLDPNADAAVGDSTDGWSPTSHVHALDLLLTAKGDSLTFNGSTYLREAVGSNGKVLTADSTSPTGRTWTTPSAVAALDDAMLFAYFIG